MTKIECIQKIGNEVCAGCDPDRDCENWPEDTKECHRIQSALRILDQYIEVMVFKELKRNIL